MACTAHVFVVVVDVVILGVIGRVVGIFLTPNRFCYGLHRPVQEYLIYVLAEPARKLLNEVTGYHKYIYIVYIYVVPVTPKGVQ